MSEHYHDENDIKLMKEMRKLAPEEFNAWLNLNSIVGRENGAIPKKYRELIALTVSCTTQCPYCGSDQRGSRRSSIRGRSAAGWRSSNAWSHGVEVFR
jgi:alkylhydroperoxidase family enzyme